LDPISISGERWKLRRGGEVRMLKPQENMEVEKGTSEYGTYIHTNILNKIVKVPYIETENSEADRHVVSNVNTNSVQYHM